MQAQLILAALLIVVRLLSKRTSCTSAARLPRAIQHACFTCMSVCAQSPRCCVNAHTSMHMQVRVLCPGGTFVAKVFRGKDISLLYAQVGLSSSIHTRCVM